MDFEDKILSREIGKTIWESGITIGTAESCTGGRIAEAVISIPGASSYFKGGVISYSDELKVSVLGVDKELIDAKTSVSEEVAVEMVKGAIRVLNVDCAVSVTGFAGPGGGTHDIPVGTIWIACGSENDVRTKKLEGDQGRDLNLANATSQALQMLLDFIESQKKEAA